MKAAETRVDRFLASSETAFAIPVYQRNYDWTRVQCQQLFNDILAIGADDTQSGHFIGSIVYVHDDVYTASGLRELTIIDGQQRLTLHSPSGVSFEVKIACIRALDKDFLPQAAPAVAQTAGSGRIRPRSRCFLAQGRRFSAQRTDLSSRFRSV